MPRLSRIFIPAIKKMLRNLEEREISRKCLSKSAAKVNKKAPRPADFTDLWANGKDWGLLTIEDYLLCDAVDAESLKVFSEEFIQLLNFYRDNAENCSEETVDENAELEDAVLGGSQGRKNLSKSGQIVTPENFRRNKEIMESIGYKGEECVNAYLEGLKNEGKIFRFEWVSKQNVISPYDFWVSDEPESKNYIDVKSTVGEFERKIHISLSELELMSSDTERYDIYRIFDIDENNRTAKLRIAEDVRSFAQGIIEVFKGLPEGVRADGISVDPSKFGLNFQAEVEIQLADEPEEESEDTEDAIAL